MQNIIREINKDVIEELKLIMVEIIIRNYSENGVFMQDLPLLLKNYIEYEGLYKLGFVNLSQFIESELNDRVKLILDTQRQLILIKETDLNRAY